MALQAMQRRLLGKGTGEGEQIGEEHAEARVRLVKALQMAMAQKSMTQVQAARLLGTDQPTLSKVLRGRTASVSLDKLVSWLVILGRSVEIRVFEPAAPVLPRFTARVSGLSDADVRGPKGDGRPIYLDHQSTTPVDPRVADLMVDVMTTRFGNAASADHLYGEEASTLVEDAAADVAALMGAAPDQVRFTSGATEAVRLAFHIARSKARGPLRIAASRVEHRAVLDQLERLEQAGAAEVRWLQVDRVGQVTLAEIDDVLAKGVDLLCLMAANNEVGTLYPVRAAVDRAHGAGAETLVDATQAAGLVDLEADAWGIDYLILSGHKLYGPKGVGALVGPWARTDTAGEVAGHAGTKNVPGAAGFGLACRIAREGRPGFVSHLRAVRDRLETALKVGLPNVSVNGDRLQRLPHNLHVSVPGAPNHAVVARLRREVAISTGAACSSGAHEPSHVLRAMALPDELQETALRISPGRMTSLEDADRAAEAIIRAASAVRAELKEYA